MTEDQRPEAESQGEWREKKRRPGPDHGRLGRKKRTHVAGSAAHSWVRKITGRWPPGWDKKRISRTEGR